MKEEKRKKGGNYIQPSRKTGKEYQPAERKTGKEYQPVEQKTGSEYTERQKQTGREYRQTERETGHEFEKGQPEDEGREIPSRNLKNDNDETEEESDDQDKVREVGEHSYKKSSLDDYREWQEEIERYVPRDVARWDEDEGGKRRAA